MKLLIWVMCLSGWNAVAFADGEVAPVDPYPAYTPTVPLGAPLCGNCLVRPLKKEKVRRISLGAHLELLALNQKLGSDTAILGGGGVHLRLRNSGRFGFDFEQGFLYGENHNQTYRRWSYPFQWSMMIWFLPNNDDRRHLNFYALGGFGIMPDTLKVQFTSGDSRSQDLVEWMAHIGLGAELRFKWFAIEAEARFVGLFLDEVLTPGSYYSGVNYAAIPEASYGFQGKLMASFWF